jgi:hypothetical protein
MIPTTHIGSLTSYVAICGHIWNYDCTLLDISQREKAAPLLDCPKCIDLLAEAKETERALWRQRDEEL